MLRIFVGSTSTFRLRQIQECLAGELGGGGGIGLEQALDVVGAHRIGLPQNVSDPPCFYSQSSKFRVKTRQNSFSLHVHWCENFKHFPFALSKQPCFIVTFYKLFHNHNYILETVFHFYFQIIFNLILISCLLCSVTEISHQLIDICNLHQLPQDNSNGSVRGQHLSIFSQRLFCFIRRKL